MERIREREKEVFPAAHPCNPFQDKYPQRKFMFTCFSLLYLNKYPLQAKVDKNARARYNYNLPIYHVNVRGYSVKSYV